VLGGKKNKIDMKFGGEGEKLSDLARNKSAAARHLFPFIMT